MRRFISIFIFVFVYLSPALVYTQQAVDVRTGLAFSRLSHTVFALGFIPTRDYHTTTQSVKGIFLSVGADYPVFRHFLFRPELNFVQNGGNTRRIVDERGPDKSEIIENIRTSSVQVPFLFKTDFRFHPISFDLYGGGGFSLLIKHKTSSSQLVTSPAGQTLHPNQEPLRIIPKNIDFIFIGGFEMTIPLQTGKIVLDNRLSKGIGHHDNELAYGITQVSYSFLLGYRIDL